MNYIIPIHNLPEDIITLYNAAQAEYSTGHFSMAHKYLSEALSRFSQNETLLTARGLLFMKKFVVPAENSIPDDIKNALKINPDYYPALFFETIIEFNRLLTQKSICDMPRIILKLETVLKKGGTSDEIFYYLVIANLLNGNKIQAFKYFSEIKNFKNASRFFYYYSYNKNMDYPNFLNGTYYKISGEPCQLSIKEYEQYKKRKKNVIISGISNYKDDLLDGKYICYRSGSDLIDYETNYSKGLQHGECKNYNENGTLAYKEYYNNGILVKREDYNNESLCKEEYYENETLREKYYRNGKLIKECYYNHGTLISENFNYNFKIPEREIIEHRDQENGFIYRKEYFSKGIKTAEERFCLKSGMISGIANFFKIPQTYLAAEIPYNGDKISGTVKRYNEAGKLTEEIEYSNGLIDGIYKKYHGSGNVFIETGIYDLFDDEDVSFGFKNDGISYRINIILGKNEITDITKHSAGISLIYHENGRLKNIYYNEQYYITFNENGDII